MDVGVVNEISPHGCLAVLCKSPSKIEVGCTVLKTWTEEGHIVSVIHFWSGPGCANPPPKCV